MPMYNFVCRQCEQSFERKLRMSQSGETQACPDCGSMDTRKTISSVALAGSSRATTQSVRTQPASSPFT